MYAGLIFEECFARMAESRITGQHGHASLDNRSSTLCMPYQTCKEPANPPWGCTDRLHQHCFTTASDQLLVFKDSDGRAHATR